MHKDIKPISLGLKKLCAKILGEKNKNNTPSNAKNLELFLSKIIL